MLKNYKVKIPTSFNMGQSFSEDIPLININIDNRYEVRVPTYNVNCNNETSRNAFDKLMLAIENCKKKLCIENGTAVIVNNNRLLHSRNKIEGDRLILRTYIKKNIDDLTIDTGSDNNIFDLEELNKNNGTY